MKELKYSKTKLLIDIDLRINLVFTLSSYFIIFFKLTNFNEKHRT